MENVYDLKLKNLIYATSSFQYQSISMGSVLLIVFLNQGPTEFLCFWKCYPHFLGQNSQKPSHTHIRSAEETGKALLITPRPTGNPGFPSQHASSRLISWAFASFAFCRLNHTRLPQPWTLPGWHPQAQPSRPLSVTSLPMFHPPSCSEREPLSSREPWCLFNPPDQFFLPTAAGEHSS